MSEPLFRCMTKGTTAEGDDIRHSLSWIFSRRGSLYVFADRLECGDWTIRYNEMQQAVLFRTRQLLIPCYVLRIKAHGRIYQFGLNPNRYWEGDLPFPATRESMALSYTWFSLALRLAAGAGLIYLWWRNGR